VGDGKTGVIELVMEGDGVRLGEAVDPPPAAAKGGVAVPSAGVGVPPLRREEVRDHVPEGVSVGEDDFPEVGVPLGGEGVVV